MRMQTKMFTGMIFFRYRPNGQSALGTPINIFFRQCKCFDLNFDGFSKNHACVVKHGQKETIQMSNFVKVPKIVEGEVAEVTEDVAHNQDV